MKFDKTQNGVRVNFENVAFLDIKGSESNFSVNAVATGGAIAVLATFDSFKEAEEYIDGVAL